MTLRNTKIISLSEMAAVATLWVVLAGPVQPAARATPLFEAISPGQLQLGERPEGANVFKLAGNFLITSMLEALRGSRRVLCRKASIAPTDLLHVVNTSLFKSPVYESYGQLVAEPRFSPPASSCASASRTCAWCFKPPRPAKRRCRQRA